VEESATTWVSSCEYADPTLQAQCKKMRGEGLWRVRRYACCDTKPQLLSHQVW
jgi:hypothetical protein